MEWDNNLYAPCYRVDVKEPLQQLSDMSVRDIYLGEFLPLSNMPSFSSGRSYFPLIVSDTELL